MLFSVAGGVFAAGSVLAIEAVAAMGRRYAQPAIGPGMRATFGPSHAPRLRLAMLGDSTAAGVGVDRVEDTVGGQLADRLAGTGVRVELTSAAVSGARSGDLDTQVARALLATPPDLAVILVGSQDVIHAVSPTRAATELAAAVGRLRDAGIPVVVGTCPELAACRAIAQPLREIVGYLGRRLGQAQIAAARVADGVPVDLGAATGTVFRADPGMLCTDGFHPSADGYRIWAHALYPAVAALHGTTR
ncbi:MAG: SGNH/GDSL hydrolase family protein [Actinocatenispora sp.]